MAGRGLIGALALLAIGYLFLASQIELDPWSEADAFNSRTLPYVYGGLLLAILTGLFFARAPQPVRPRRVGRLVALISVIVGFVIVLPLVGLWIALAVLIAGAGLVLGERRVIVLAAPAVCVPLVGWAVIEHGLGIVIPL